jgi:hypothetical protein
MIADYAGLEMLVLLVWGAAACTEMMMITGALGASLPRETLTVVQGTSHFLVIGEITQYTQAKVFYSGKKIEYFQLAPENFRCSRRQA